MGSHAHVALQRTQQQPSAAPALSKRRGAGRLGRVLLAVGACASALPGGLAFSQAPSYSLRAGPGGSSPVPVCGQRPPSVSSHHAAGAGGGWAGVAAAAAWAVLPLAILVGSPALAAEDLSTGPLKAAAQKGTVPTLETTSEKMAPPKSGHPL